MPTPGIETLAETHNDPILERVTVFASNPDIGDLKDEEVIKKVREYANELYHDEECSEEDIKWADGLIRLAECIKEEGGRADGLRRLRKEWHQTDQVHWSEQLISGSPWQIHETEPSGASIPEVTESRQAQIHRVAAVMSAIDKGVNPRIFTNDPTELREIKRLIAAANTVGISGLEFLESFPSAAYTIEDIERFIHDMNNARIRTRRYQGIAALTLPATFALALLVVNKGNNQPIAEAASARPFATTELTTPESPTTELSTITTHLEATTVPPTTVVATTVRSRPTTTVSRVKPTIPPTTINATAPPATDTSMEKEPQSTEHSEYQAKLGRPLIKIEIKGGESYTEVSDRLTKLTGENWDAATVKAYLGELEDVEFVPNCPGGTILIRAGDTLEGPRGILEKYHLNMGLIRMYNHGEPLIGAGYCLEISDRDDEGGS